MPLVFVVFGLGAIIGTNLAGRFAQAAPTLAAAVSVSAFNGGTALGTWLGASALESSLGVVGPLTVAIGMAILGLLTMTAMRVTGNRK